MKDALIYPKKGLKLFLSSFFLSTRNPEFRGRITNWWHSEAKLFRSHFFLRCSSRNSWLRRKKKGWPGSGSMRVNQQFSSTLHCFRTPQCQTVYLKWEEWEKIGVRLGAREAWEGILRAPQPNTNLLSPQRHVNSDRERVSLSLSPGLSAKQRRY